MVSTLRQFLAPPVFTGDDVKTRLAAQLNSILLITLGVNLALNPALILVLENSVPSLMVDGTLVVLLIGVWFLMRRGQVRLASLLFCLTLWVYISFVSLTFGGFDSLLPAGYIVLIFVAGILLEEHAPQLPAEVQHYLQRLRYGASHMGALIDDLLEFSRLGWQALNLQPVNTASLVRAILNDLRPEQAQRQLELVVGALPDCQADSAWLKQVWVNLLSNAFKYTRQRAAAPVEIGALTPGDEVVYFVRDNGAGFDMRYAGKLFGVFQRLHRMDAFEGTGVGLATVKRIVERHGGRIWAEAEPDRGTTFYVALPAR